ncbi:MAG: glycoside hydrolase, partial [Verrucomicrobiota bacterium]|nr:glycoside hydrolase [Verrucomicrobiota bacterium]
YCTTRRPDSPGVLYTMNHFFRFRGRVRLLALLALLPFWGAPFTTDGKEGSSTEVQWDASTDRVVSHTDKSAAYPRAKRLSNGEILLGYHHGGGLGEWGTWVTLRLSRDGGASWYATRDLERPEGEAFYGFSNVDFVELGGGRVLLVTAGRGKPVPGQPVFLSECERSELRLRFSTDHGATWGDPIGLVRGRGRIWEPAIVRLPAGELEIYYAIEAPDLRRDGGLDQRIELVRSDDDGKTWSAPAQVSHHAGCRNGMPIPDRPLERPSRLRAGSRAPPAFPLDHANVARPARRGVRRAERLWIRRRAISAWSPRRGNAARVSLRLSKAAGAHRGAAILDVRPCVGASWRCAGEELWSRRTAVAGTQ